MNNENRNISYQVAEELFTTLDKLLPRRENRQQKAEKVQQERRLDRQVQAPQTLKPRLGR
jgi:hypothetical protein